ncbi:hypothetical protein NON20_18225 [Synechocystis sp. B12]|nr:hypothetical protein NON20_18225 [Synechocystis sp. B12]
MMIAGSGPVNAVVRPNKKFTTYPQELFRHQILTVSASVLLQSSMAIASNVRVVKKEKIVAQIG